MIHDRCAAQGRPRGGGFTSSYSAAMVCFQDNRGFQRRCTRADEGLQERVETLEREDRDLKREVYALRARKAKNASQGLWSVLLRSLYPGPS